MLCPKAALSESYESELYFVSYPSLHFLPSPFFLDNINKKPYDIYPDDVKVC